MPFAAIAPIAAAVGAATSVAGTVASIARGTPDQPTRGINLGDNIGATPEQLSMGSQGQPNFGGGVPLGAGLNSIQLGSQNQGGLLNSMQNYSQNGGGY